MRTNIVNSDPKGNVLAYEILDEDRVIVKLKRGGVKVKKIYHIGTSGILCNDFDTFIDFKQAKEIEFE